MKTHRPPATGDESLDNDERAVAAVYARLGTAKPDAALDAAIRARARAAVTSHRRMRPWAVGLSSAAVLVLAAGLAWRSGTSLQPVMAPQAAPTTNEATTEPEPMPVQPTQGLSPTSASPPPPPMIMRQQASPAPGSALESSSHRSREVPTRDTHTAAGMAGNADIAATTGGVEAARRAAAASPPAVATTSADIDTRIENIRQLLRDDRHDDAVEALRTLRRDHPDYPLPDDLAALLPD